ncbi:MAG: PIG-L family deacetylase [Propionibacteriaceae bacterium]|jgi:LmbE family N-acetylglucosaminyl deacetylase|nr:PIG-L family deacetylase [Propionibacteriaceae bacterium]
MMDSLLVIVPHPDDEILTCGGWLYERQARGLPTWVVVVTNGDVAGSAAGLARLRESLAGLQVLGVRSDQVVFLGYADTGMSVDDSFLYGLFAEDDSSRIHLGRAGVATYGLPDHLDFRTRMYGRAAPYTRGDLVADLRALIGEHRPETIVTTAPEDTHGDHAALYWFVREVVSGFESYRPNILTALVHSADGDAAWPRRSGEDTAMTVPYCLAGYPLPISRLLTPQARLAKGAALRCHATALTADAREFLEAFLKRDELFWIRQADD